MIPEQQGPGVPEAAEAPCRSVLDTLAGSSKYRHLAPAVLERTAAWALERHRRPADATKAAKRKLHQAFGAYLDMGGVNNLQSRLDALAAGADLRTTCRSILRLHRSSAERLDHLEDFYRAILAETGQPSHVLDIAAGLNAFALPFTGLDPSVRYTAIEIDRRLVGAIDRFLEICGRSGAGVWCDVLDGFDTAGADLVLLLKTLPCLERQRAGAGLALLEHLAHVPLVVVSYPVRSLGGRHKNMRRTYRADIEALAGGAGRTPSFLPLDDELVAVLARA